MYPQDSSKVDVKHMPTWASHSTVCSELIEFAGVKLDSIKKLFPYSSYWAVQARLLTPLTFAWHR